MATTTGSRKRRRKNKKNTDIVQCSACGKFKAKTEFFISYNEMHAANGVLPYCKTCIRSMCTDANGEISRPKTLQMLRTIDRPYIEELWIKAINRESKNKIGNYLRLINLQQYRCLKWKDGDLDVLERPLDIKPTLTDLNKVEPIKTEIEKFKDFKVNDEIIRLFGNGFTDEEYFHMWNKYNFLKAYYPEQTSMHTEALITYVRYKVKEEMAVANDRSTDAKTWGELAMKQAERAKINPNQFSKADLQGGLNTIGEIAQAVEQEQDIIKILPKFRFRPNDAVDFCIWNYINYARELEGKPTVEYSDVYKFYDKMKESYMAETGDSYGIFKDDPTEENRPKIEKFIELPEEYNEEGQE